VAFRIPRSYDELLEARAATKGVKKSVLIAQYVLKGMDSGS
jgi:hypothetical protein